MYNYSLFCNDRVTSEIFKSIWNKLIDDWGIILTSIQFGIETKNYKAWVYNNYVYILNKESGGLVSWYYLTDVGNHLRYNLPFDFNGMVEFLNNFKEEVDNYDLWG